MGTKFFVSKNVVTEDDIKILTEAVSEMMFYPVHDFEGAFKKRVFNKENGYPTAEIISVVKKLIPLSPEDQNFNHVSFTRLNEGDFQKEHQPMRTSVGYSVELVFGNFNGGEYIVDGKDIELNPGDVLVMQNTIGYSMGPRHSVSKVTKGTRYSVIVNTVVENKTFEK